MDVFDRSFSRWLRVGASAACLAAGSACVVDEMPPLTATTSLRVDLLSPEPGSPDARLPAEERDDVVVRIRALDARNLRDVAFEGTVDVYAHYLGSLTPSLRETPLASIELSRGDSGEVSLELPPVYGDTYLWAENVRGEDATFSTGTSEPMYFREPHVVDVREPEDRDALDALESSPLAEKQVRVSESRHGDTGRLVVSSVSSDGFTVQDVNCQDEDGTPPCAVAPYNSVFVYTFSRPTDHEGRSIERGHVISELYGGITLFNGLTQLAYPQTIVADEAPDPERIPPPVTIDPAWLAAPIELDQHESGLLAVEGGEVCPLDDDYDFYSQWKLDIGQGCGDPINVITEGRVEGFDPADYVGETLPRVVGTLLPVNLGSFHVWIIYPRDADDVELPGAEE